MKYTAPKFEIYEVVAERGYQASSTSASFELNNFGTETDSWE